MAKSQKCEKFNKSQDLTNVKTPKMLISKCQKYKTCKHPTFLKILNSPNMPNSQTCRDLIRSKTSKSRNYKQIQKYQNFKKLQ